MKLKQLILGSAAIVAGAWALTSCGGGNTTDTSSDAEKEGLFGKIPSLYEEPERKMMKEMKGLDEKEVMKALEEIMPKMEDEYKKMMEKAQGLADKMTGRKVAYSMADSLPYRIVSDIIVESVNLGGGKDLKLNLTFDAVLTQDLDKPLIIYSFVQSDDQPICLSSTSKLNKQTAGDTLHVKHALHAPQIPAKYAERCNNLRFISEQTFQAQRITIQEQLREWYNEGEREKKALMD